MVQTPKSKRMFAAALVGLTAIFGTDTASGASRIKDIADFQGVRTNQLIGYGLVVGLNGTGDSLTNSPFTQQSLIGMLERLGVNTRDSQATLRTKNVAAVMVTANLPPFARQGSPVDVTVAALGDATSLLGGALLVTPLLGADGEVYAVAQGAVSTSGFTVTGQGATTTKNIPTAGRVSNGGIVERELGFEMASLKEVRIALRNPDLTTARRVAQAINAMLAVPAARSLDPSTILLILPEGRQNDLVNVLTDIEQLSVEPDTVARVVIDERSGIIVMGENVRINTVAVAQGNLTIRITETPQVSQPAPFAQQGTTVTVPRTELEVNQGEDRRMTILQNSVTLQELVRNLNALGVGPRDIISILQAIKAAGALQADIEVL